MLIQPPHHYGGWERFPRSFPLGLAYIAKSVLNAGHKVEVFDIWAHKYTKEEVLKRIKNLDCDLIGIGALSTQYAYTKWLIKELKNINGCPIVVGNALATLTPEIVLNHTQADICVIGEGEFTFNNLIENLNKLEKVNGIHFRHDGEVVKNKPQDYVKDLDSVDFPAWDLFPMDVYLKNCRIPETGIPAMNVVSGRGCPYSCRFCSKTFRSVRFRSINNIVKEIELLVEKYNISGVAFSDELLVINRERTIELCEKIKPLGIKWGCQGRSNLVDFELLKQMKEAGCVSIGYGIESGSQTILNNMNKQITVEQSRKAITETVKLGMLPVVQLMYGYHGENRTTLMETLQFLKSLPFIKRSTLSITTPLPGSELWNYAIESGMIKDEEKFLEQLAGGYAHDSGGPLMNFTDFSDEDFYRILKIVEREFFLNKLKRYPHLLLKDYILRAVIQYRMGGFWHLVKRAIRFIKWVG